LVDVRACDVVLEVLVPAGPEAVAVSFDPGVLGERASAGRRLALSFSARQDAPLPSPLAMLSDTGGAAVGADQLRVLSAECFDRHGAPAAEPDLSLR